MIYAIPESNLDRMMIKFDKLSRRAAKTGQPAPVLTCIHEQDIKNSSNQIVRYMFMELEGVRPQINGWTFVGTVDHTEEINIIRSVPGQNLPDEFRDSQPYCDHCKMTRRRNSTYVLIKDGSYKQVGRNCLQDFIGSTDLNRFMNLLEIIMDIDELMEECSSDRGHGSIPRYEIEEVLRVTYKVIKHLGWTSRAKSVEFGKPSTSSYVGVCLNSDHADIKKYHPELMSVVADDTDEDIIMKEVDSALEWLVGLDTSGSDYLYNIQVIGKLTSMTGKLMGLACSILPAYRRATQPIVESNHVGEKGNRYLFKNMRVMRIGRSVDGQFGTTTPVNMTDASGNVYVWWASNVPRFIEENIEKKECVDVVATIKGHGEFRSIKQTNLTRVTLANMKNIKKLGVIE